MVKKNNDLRNFLILLSITLIDFAIPDPIPVLDELVLSGWTVFLGIKLLK